MKKRQSNRFIYTVFIFLALTACVSTQTMEEVGSSNKAEQEISNPFNIEAIIYNESGVAYLNSEHDSLKILIPGNMIIWDKKISPNKEKVVISYSVNEIDSTFISIIDTKLQKVSKVHSVHNSYYYTIAWSPNGDKIAVGYQNEIEQNGDTVAGDGGIEIISNNGNVRSPGCSNLKQVHYWLPNGNLVVSQGRGYQNIYVVHADDCRTVTNIEANDKENISFSPDGEYMSYIERREVYFLRGQSVRNTPGLFISNYDGTEAKMVVDYRFTPQNVSWSPDSKNLIFDVSSQEWSNIRHIGIYNIQNDRATYSIHEDINYGLPSSTKPMWSPDGNYILFSNVYSERPNSYGFVYDSVIRSISNNEYTVVDSDVQSINERDSNRAFASPVFWIDNRTVLIGSFDEYRIIDIDREEKLTYSYEEMGGFIRVFLYINRL